MPSLWWTTWIASVQVARTVVRLLARKVPKHFMHAHRRSRAVSKVKFNKSDDNLRQEKHAWLWEACHSYSRSITSQKRQVIVHTNNLSRAWNIHESVSRDRPPCDVFLSLRTTCRASRPHARAKGGPIHALSRPTIAQAATATQLLQRSPMQTRRVR
jgi:hypothetical protein